MQKSKLQFKIKSFYFLVFVLSLSFLLFSFNFTEAAELKLIAPMQKFGVNQQFQVDLLLDTEGEEINAAEVKIFFPGELLEMKEIRDGNSIINFWIERPKVEQAGIIGFSGIIPGGYQETKGFVFSVVFRAKTSGNGAIEIRDAKVLLNDGKGTPVNVKIPPFQFSISQEVPSVPPMVEIIKDTDPPEDFKPEIASDPNVFDGKWFLVFATQDKGTGIAYYAIRETRRKINIKRETDAKWVEAESPYVLKDQKLRSWIYVKAIDKAGNERIAVLPPRYPLSWYENYLIWVIIILIALIVISGFLIYRFYGGKNSR